MSSLCITIQKEQTGRDNVRALHGNSGHPMRRTIGTAVGVFHHQLNDARGNCCLSLRFKGTNVHGTGVKTSRRLRSQPQRAAQVRQRHTVIRGGVHPTELLHPADRCEKQSAQQLGKKCNTSKSGEEGPNLNKSFCRENSQLTWIYVGCCHATTFSCQLSMLLSLIHPALQGPWCEGGTAIGIGFAVYVSLACSYL